MVVFHQLIRQVCPNLQTSTDWEAPCEMSSCTKYIRIMFRASDKSVALLVESVASTSKKIARVDMTL